MEPELRSGPERLRKEPGRLRSHPPLSADDFVHPLKGNLQVFRERDLGDAEGLEEFLQEHFPWMRGNPLLRKHVDAFQW